VYAILKKEFKGVPSHLPALEIWSKTTHKYERFHAEDYVNAMKIHSYEFGTGTGKVDRNVVAMKIVSS